MSKNFLPHPPPPSFPVHCSNFVSFSLCNSIAASSLSLSLSFCPAGKCSSISWSGNLWACDGVKMLSCTVRQLCETVRNSSSFHTSQDHEQKWLRNTFLTSSPTFRMIRIVQLWVVVSSRGSWTLGWTDRNVYFLVQQPRRTGLLIAFTADFITICYIGQATDQISQIS